MLRGQGQGRLEAVGPDHLQDRPEDFVLIALHARRDPVEEGGADEEAGLIALQAEIAAIDDQFGALVHPGLDVVGHPLAVGGVDHRAIVGTLVGGDPHLERADLGDQLLAQGVGSALAHGHHHGQSHAALPGRAEGGAREVAHHLVQVRIRQDDAVVLGAAHGLDPLSGRCPPGIDVLGDVRRAHEADGSDLGVVEDGVHHDLVALDDVEHALQVQAQLRARLHEQLGEADRDGGITFRRLEDEGVADGEGDPRHP